LTNQSLTVYKSRQERDTKPKVIDLNHSTARETHEEGKRSIELLAQDGQHYFFSTEFETDIIVWLASIKTVTDALMNVALTNNQTYQLVRHKSGKKRARTFF